MGTKKLQGADGMNFQLQLTIKGLESINLPEENLANESGNDIMKISCWGGKLSAYVNLPNAIRPNNVQPFQLSDCIKIELVRNQVIEHMRSYLQKHLKDKYSDEFLSMMSVTKMECNLTIKCVGDCKPKDVIRLFERSFAKVTVYKETDPNGKTHRKPERGITTTKPHEWVLKVYDKTFQQRQAGNLKVESNLIRVELVFLDRMLDRMYSSKKSLEDILTRKAIKTLIDQYQETFDEICKKNITPMVLELPTTLIDLSAMENSMARMMLETINNMMIELYASMAQAEIEKKEKRQREGIEQKKARGEWDDYGRPRVMDLEEFATHYRLVQQGEKKPFELMKELGMTKPTFYRYKNQIEKGC